MFFPNPAYHIRFFSVVLDSDIDPGYIHWALTLFQSEKFQQKFSQYVCYIIWESHGTKLQKKKFDTGPNHGGGPSVPLQQTVDIITLISPKKIWVQNCLKLILGNYNAYEAMSSFNKNLRHVLKGKNPSSGLRFKHENIAFINTTHATKILWIAL